MVSNRMASRQGNTYKNGIRNERIRRNNNNNNKKKATLKTNSRRSPSRNKIFHLRSSCAEAINFANSAD